MYIEHSPITGSTVCNSVYHLLYTSHHSPFLLQKMFKIKDMASALDTCRTMASSHLNKEGDNRDAVESRKASIRSQLKLSNVPEYQKLVASTHLLVYNTVVTTNKHTIMHSVYLCMCHAQWVEYWLAQICVLVKWIYLQFCDYKVNYL